MLDLAYAIDDVFFLLLDSIHNPDIKSHVLKASGASGDVSDYYLALYFHKEPFCPDCYCI